MPIRISVEDAHALWKDEGATILDVVDTGTWEREKLQVKGAARIPPEEIKTRYRELPSDKPVLAYCT